MAVDCVFGGRPGKVPAVVLETTRTTRAGGLAGARRAAAAVGRVAWPASALVACGIALAPLSDARARDGALALLGEEQGETSRVTLEAPKAAGARVEASSDSITIRMPKGTGFDATSLAGPLPRRIAAILPLPDGVRIFAATGTTLRHHRSGDRIVIEAADGPARTTGAGRAELAGEELGLSGSSRTTRAAPADLRLAALGGMVATDAPSLLTGPGAIVAALPGPAAGAGAPAAPAQASGGLAAVQGPAGAQPASSAGPLVVAQAPPLPPVPAAARSGFVHTPVPGRPGPYGAADTAGRPGLTVQAQAPVPSVVQPPAPPGAAPGAVPGGQVPGRPGQPVPIILESGSGRLLQLPGPAFTIMSADPRVLRVQPASPTSIFVMGVALGRTNIIATGEDGSPVVEYDVTVMPGRGAAPGPTTNAPIGAPPLNAANIESMIRRLVRGGEGVRVAALANTGLVLSGLVPSAAESQRAEAIAKAYAGEGRPVINSIQLLSSIQVNIRVRVAEVARTVTRELGFNWTVLANDGAGLALGLRTGAAASIVDAITGRTTAGASDPGRYAGRYQSSRFDINSVVDALAGDQLISILAEPNLTAQSGEVASFLAGGEFPVPVNASAVTGAIGIEFKQFGVSLGFVPTVLSPERLNLRVRPEVSELSDNGAISLPLANGVVRIPALTVRRAETTIELGSGQSFAIAGLLQRSTVLNASSLIGLGDIPVLGALFRSDRFRRQETELVIIITPYLVRPTSDQQALTIPNENFRPATDLDRIVYRRQLARGAPPAQPRLPADTGFIVE